MRSKSRDHAARDGLALVVAIMPMRDGPREWGALVAARAARMACMAVHVLSQAALESCACASSSMAAQ